MHPYKKPKSRHNEPLTPGTPCDICHRHEAVRRMWNKFLCATCAYGRAQIQRAKFKGED